ncbi:hypothetical protein DPX16_9880 [Anabarilius grahami]|uniref:Uncharacterized protein n=1 Tax=Anabarilius grahami TaxID=495550 RepID=A0A3N0Y3V3_ANAGA|nr:hypothetical protein DPX16_9880 [Anabarilius grahami]
MCINDDCRRGFNDVVGADEDAIHLACIESLCNKQFCRKAYTELNHAAVGFTLDNKDHAGVLDSGLHGCFTFPLAHIATGAFVLITMK